MNNIEHDYSDYKDSLRNSRDINDGSLSPFTFVCVVLIILCLGLVTLYSASYPEAVRSGNNHYDTLLKQVVFALLGLVCSVIIYYLPESVIKKSSIPLLLLALIFMVLTLFSPFGVTVFGAKRWLKLPYIIQFQPSEFLKLSMILFLSYFFSEERFKRYMGWYYLIPIVLFLLFCVLIVMQKAYTTTILFALTCLVLLIKGGFKVRYILTFTAFISVPLLFIMLSESYRIKRVASFLFPKLDPAGLNWQVNMSLSAIKEGGVVGKGLGNGIYKHGLIPEVQNDFIFSSFVEECGILSVAFLFILFILFALLGYKASERLRIINPFYSNLALGTTSMIIFQVIINICVVTGLLPPTGIPLPFFSQGGTNLLVVIVECGLLYKIISYSIKVQNGEK